MILIIAPPTDDHAVPVARELQRRGHQVAIFDVAELPERARISIEFGPMRARLERDVGSFDFNDVRSIWLRRLSRPVPHPALADQGFASSEVQHVLIGLAQTLEPRVWVNPLASLAMDGGWGKVRQLDEARMCGLEIPRTLITNDPERARAFIDSCPAGSIYKPLASVELPGRDRVWRAMFTNAVDDEARERLPRVRHAPSVFQENVPKARELRVTVIGGRVFACALDTQRLENSKIDYRHSYMQHPRERHELPSEVANALVALHSRLGLVFGTCDLILRPDGRYVFLETNQQGQWNWCADVFPGDEVLHAFCDLLEGR